MKPLLQVSAVDCGYGDIPVLRNVTLEVNQGEIVVLLGPNGAGKTTTVLAVAGELPISHGTIRLFGRQAGGPLQQRARNGLGLVTEERSVFKRLSVQDNLRVGRADPGLFFSLFPELSGRARTLAGDLSGGEQQMLSIGRALARHASLLIVDELSLGLAPLIVDRLFTVVRDAARVGGAGALVIEQHVAKALEYSDKVYVMKQGEAHCLGPTESLAASRGEIEEMYFGGNQ